MINVGGYKINPNEVEDAIRKINGIQDVRVYSMPNSVLGNIICCELIKNVEELTETDIRKILRVQLQEYKIPLVMRFVEKIALTRTGKVKR
jgi:acyl-CoA synthetase (AMP-forming)/AMP-acid ligase II